MIPVGYGISMMLEYFLLLKTTWLTAGLLTTKVGPRTRQDPAPRSGPRPVHVHALMRPCIHASMRRCVHAHVFVVSCFVDSWIRGLAQCIPSLFHPAHEACPPHPGGESGARVFETEAEVNTTARESDQQACRAFPKVFQRGSCFSIA